MPAEAPRIVPEAAPSLTIFEALREAPPPPAAAMDPGSIDWAALAAPAHPLPSRPLPSGPFPSGPAGLPGAELGLFAPAREASAMAPQLAAPAGSSAGSVGEFALFSALGAAREDVPAPPPAPPGSTLSRLKQVVNHAGQASLPEPVTARGPNVPVAPPAGNSFPAAAVTVPLGEVMRLVATGGPPAASPFDTFRAALRAPSSF